MVPYKFTRDIVGLSKLYGGYFFYCQGIILFSFLFFWTPKNKSQTVNHLLSYQCFRKAKPGKTKPNQTKIFFSPMFKNLRNDSATFKGLCLHRGKFQKNLKTLEFCDDGDDDGDKVELTFIGHSMYVLECQLLFTYIILSPSPNKNLCHKCCFTSHFAGAATEE